MSSFILPSEKMSGFQATTNMIENWTEENSDHWLDLMIGYADENQPTNLKAPINSVSRCRGLYLYLTINTGFLETSDANQVAKDSI